MVTRSRMNPTTPTTDIMHHNSAKVSYTLRNYAKNQMNFFLGPIVSNAIIEKLISLPLLKLHPLNSSFSSLSLHQPAQAHLPPNYEHFLLSLLHKYQPKRNPILQIHSQLITTSLHKNHMNQTSIIIWNTFIKHYLNSPSPQQSIHVYKQMLDVCAPNPPTDTFTFSFLLKACAKFSGSCVGTQFHSLVVKNGFALHLYVHTSIVNMYATCGFLVNAEKAFDEMPERSSVSWNAMITGFAKWGGLEKARAIFEQMPCPNVVSWTGLIDGYARTNQASKALVLFHKMSEMGVMPTEITILAVVPSVCYNGSLELGRMLHAHCEKRCLMTLDVQVENSLIDMYAKCGSIANSKKVFDFMLERKNAVSWTSIITAYAMHGMVKEAIELFDEMVKARVNPNRVTFLSVLNACSHGGLLEEGLRYFSSMVYEYGIEPEIKHYGCIIDMMGRAGRLKEAEEMILGLPLEVNVIVWRTLLGCCGKYGEVEMGESVMRRIIELEKEYGGDFVVLSNLLNEAGRFEDAETVRRMVDERDLIKAPGLSLIP